MALPNVFGNGFSNPSVQLSNLLIIQGLGLFDFWGQSLPISFMIRAILWCVLFFADPFSVFVNGQLLDAINGKNNDWRVGLLGFGNDSLGDSQVSVFRRQSINHQTLPKIVIPAIAGVGNLGICPPKPQKCVRIQ